MLFYLSLIQMEYEWKNLTSAVPDRKQVFGDDEEDWDNEEPVAGGGEHHDCCCSVSK